MDAPTDFVGVGSIVNLIDSNSVKIEIIILVLGIAIRTIIFYLILLLLDKAPG